MYLPYENLICKSLGLPYLQWGVYLSEPLLTVSQGRPTYDEAINLPAFHPSGTLLKKTGHMHPLNRFIDGAVCRFINYFYWLILYPRWRFWNDDQKTNSLYDKINTDLVLGDGYLGIRERKQDMQRQHTVIPATRTAS